MANSCSRIRKNSEIDGEIRRKSHDICYETIHCRRKSHDSRYETPQRRQPCRVRRQHGTHWHPDDNIVADGGSIAATANEFASEHYRSGVGERIGV